MKTFHCEVITPDGSFFNGEVGSVQVPGTLGGFEVLHNHAPLISSLAKGKVNLTLTESDKKTFTIEGGIVEVLNNNVVVLAEKIVA